MTMQILITMINVKAHDLVGTGEEEAKKLPGNLLGLLLTMPKQVVIFIIIRILVITIILIVIIKSTCQL